MGGGPGRTAAARRRATRDAGGLGVARAVGRGGGVPVLYVTGLGSPAVLDALAPAPVILKPFTRLDLVRHVSDLVSTRRN